MGLASGLGLGLGLGFGLGLGIGSEGRELLEQEGARAHGERRLGSEAARDEERGGEARGRAELVHVLERDVRAPAAHEHREHLRRGRG